MSKISLIPTKYKCRMCGEIFESANTRICNVTNSPEAIAKVLRELGAIPHQCMSDFINSKVVMDTIGWYPTEPNFLTFYGIADCIGVKVLAQTEGD